MGARPPANTVPSFQQCANTYISQVLADIGTVLAPVWGQVLAHLKGKKCVLTLDLSP